VLAVGGWMLGGSVRVDEGKLRHACPGEQVGGCQQAQGLGTLLWVIGGSAETDHCLANLAAGDVPAARLDKLIGLRQG
jgi:hypothetical protein